ncbi:unnamed protein product [Prorocentrum cordatum]|uniref:Uncharacterized protein n=1 Tax=Prorocentrum cordatum TaxID=2364126 RepID=A0ABN9YBT9_9DINO|nr:unnamed protein product [Polarella glacialis]
MHTVDDTLEGTEFLTLTDQPDAVPGPSPPLYRVGGVLGVMLKAQQLVSSLARRVARRKGTEVHVEERRIWCRISIEIWRRAVRMIRRCLPSHAQEVADEDDAYHDPDVEFRRGHPGSVVTCGVGVRSRALGLTEGAASEKPRRHCSLCRLIEKSNKAAADALSAAQVAIWTEVIAVIGTLAGILTSWVGYNMDESRLPQGMRVPKVDTELPGELLRTPGGGAAQAVGATAAGAVAAASWNGGFGAAVQESQASAPPAQPVRWPSETATDAAPGAPGAAGRSAAGAQPSQRGQRGSGPRAAAATAKAAPQPPEFSGAEGAGAVRAPDSAAGAPAAAAAGPQGAGQVAHPNSASEARHGLPNARLAFLP